jgi:hypothetical protein
LSFQPIRDEYVSITGKPDTDGDPDSAADPPHPAEIWVKSRKHHHAHQAMAGRLNRFDVRPL